MMSGAKSGLNLRPSAAVMTGKPRSIQKLSLFQYSGVVPFARRKVPGPPTRFLTSPPPSSGAGNSGLSAGSGRSVVYLNQDGRSSGGLGDQRGVSLSVGGSESCRYSGAEAQGRKNEGSRTGPSARTAARNMLFKSGYV